MTEFVLPFRRPLDIGIIGTGIAGMSAAWLLNQGHDITVYERESRIGGHSNTVDAPTLRARTPVDTGFIVYNEATYPNLTALFRHLDVPTKPSSMSFAASLDAGRVEYSGTDLNGLLGQRLNIVKPRFWRMVGDLLRFYREAPLQLENVAAEKVGVGTWLRQSGYSDAFIEDHILPMAAAIWSTTAAEIKDYPAAAFIRFFASHGLLALRDRPQWRTVDGGSREYVNRLTASFRDRIRFGGVRSVRRHGDKVFVEESDGTRTAHDHIVIATHADEALQILDDADPTEARLLGTWRYTRNRAVLHCDTSLMPKRRRVWSSWNFISDATSREAGPLCVTYWMNKLQSLDHRDQLFVTLNPVREPAPGSVMREFEYTHPFFDNAALASQRELWSLQGQRRTWFCGSYFGYGFHEDALQAGLAVAEQLGGLRRPWRVSEESGRIQITHDRRMAA